MYLHNIYENSQKYEAVGFLEIILKRKKELGRINKLWMIYCHM